MVLMINIRDVTPSQLRALQFSVQLAEGEAIVSAKHGAPTGARHCRQDSMFFFRLGR